MDDICAEYQAIATSLHGERIPNFDEFGFPIDDEQEAYLKAVETGAPLPPVPASGMPNLIKFDANRRPKMVYALHPGHRRPPLVKMSHPAYKAHARANRNAYQFHRCQKLCFKYGGVICRFRYPRRLYFGKARLCYRGAGASGKARKRVYVELPRDHSFLNPTQEVIQTSWAGNVDLQRIVDDLSAYDPAFVTLPDPSSFEARAAALAMASGAHSVAGTVERLVAIG